MSKFLKLIVVLLLMPLAISRQSAIGSIASIGPKELKVTGWPLEKALELNTRPSVFDKQTTRSIFFKGASGASLSDLVDITLFAEYRPGLTIEQTVRRYGTPIKTQSLEDRTVAIYETKDAQIVVDDKYVASGCASYHSRTLYAYPKDASNTCVKQTSNFFHGSINTLIPKTESIEVGVAEAGNGDRIWALVRDNCVEVINWWTPTSQP